MIVDVLPYVIGRVLVPVRPGQFKSLAGRLLVTGEGVVNDLPRRPGLHPA